MLLFLPYLTACETFFFYFLLLTSQFLHPLLFSSFISFVLPAIPFTFFKFLYLKSLPAIFTHFLHLFLLTDVLSYCWSYELFSMCPQVLLLLSTGCPAHEDLQNWKQCDWERRSSYLQRNCSPCLSLPLRASVSFLLVLRMLHTLELMLQQSKDVSPSLFFKFTSAPRDRKSLHTEQFVTTIKHGKIWYRMGFCLTNRAHAGLECTCPSD